MRGNGLLEKEKGPPAGSGPLGASGGGPEKLAGGVELLYQARNKKEHILRRRLWKREARCPPAREELLALEQQLECEWRSLHGALNAVAELQAGRPSADQTMLRNLQALARDIDRRRVALSVRIAEEARARPPLTGGCFG